MKEYIIAKMSFLFLHFMLIVFYIRGELINPCWGSFIRGAGTALFVCALIKDIVDIIKKK